MNVFRWGILAPGHIARKFAEAVSGISGHTLAGVASRSPERAAAFLADAGLQKSARIFPDYKALVESPDIDAVYVASPHPFHRDLVLLAIEAGKPVLCEKPMGVNTGEAEAMINAAHKKGVFLMEAMWTHFLPVMQAIRKKILAGEIGTLRMIRADFSFNGQPDPQARHLNPSLAGGGLLDVGIYPLALAFRHLGPDPQIITGAGEIGPTGVDIQGGMILKYRSGALAVLSCGVATNGPVTAEIIGTAGVIEIPRMFHMAESARIVKPSGSEDLHYPFRVNGFEYEAEETALCVQTGLTESATMPLSETLALARTMDAIRNQWGLRYPFET
jgi:predicted dehydrogenase